ncbi:MAG: hypothetical protein R8K48_02340 [Gallionella sp.]
MDARIGMVIYPENGVSASGRGRVTQHINTLLKNNESPPLLDNFFDTRGVKHTFFVTTQGRPEPLQPLLGGVLSSYHFSDKEGLNG